MKNNNLIIQKKSNLFTIEIRNIEPTVLSLFESIYFENYPKSTPNEYLLNRFNHLLNGFCYLKKTKLTFIGLTNDNLNIFWSEYLFFLKNCVEMDSTRFVRILNKIISHLNLHYNSNIIVDDSTIESLSFDDNSIKYLNGWKITTKSRRSYEYLQLCEYVDIHGFNEAEKIEKILNQTNKTISVYIFNNLISFLNKDESSIFKIEKPKLIEFLQEFFSKKEKPNLNSNKKEWNSLIELLTAHFNLNEKYDLRFVIQGSNNTNEMRIKHIGTKQYKDKLISLVPLEIKDEKALMILKEKVNQDIYILKEWANHVLKELKQDRLTKRCLQSLDYNLSPIDVRKKYGLLPHHKTKEFFDKETVFNEKHLFAICSLLIESHPKITDSFLAKCNIKTSLVDGIYTEGAFLVSNKSRRGAELAEQKIGLTPETKEIIQDYLFLTKDLRDNLKNNNHKLQDVMFVCCSNNHPLEIKQPLEFKTSYVQKSICEFLIKEGYSEEDAKSYSNSITLSKVRSTKAIQIYFETENTSKMAEALGHHKYNANLLSHYLPKSILDFFQERWIRVFQKGIILEAVKDTPYILETTKFKNMDEVNEFLKNHTFKFKDSENTIDNSKEELITDKTSYISINEINLHALASIHEAVHQSTKKDLVNQNAFYWSSFYEKLSQTIKRDYQNFVSILEIASTNKNASIFSEVIYA